MDFNDYYQKLTAYLRVSVLDSERLSPDKKALFDAVKSPKNSKVKKETPFTVDASTWEAGQIDKAITTDIFSTLKLGKKVTQTPVVIMPRVDLLSVSSGVSIGPQSKIITPLVVEVFITRDGKLKPNKPPVVPRDWLEPNDSGQATFAHVDAVDQFITQNPFNVETWNELKQYCTDMLAYLLVDDTESNVEPEPQSIFELTLLEDYQLKAGISLMLLSPPIIAGFHIVKIYDAILSGEPLNALFKSFLSPKNTPPVMYKDLTLDVEASSKHKGQMTGEFPLADKQRNALHYISQMENGDVLAVNGPPGTGKTTLLRSVVANMWVNAALNGGQPPIIAAASSSNQAVTNILDSFHKIDETQVEQSLRDRWLPDISCYGLYARGTHVKPEQAGYAFMQKKGEGIMQSMEETPLEELSTFFFEKFNLHFNTSDVKSTDKAVKQLHFQLKNCCELQNKLHRQFHDLDRVIETCNGQYGSDTLLAESIEAQSKQHDDLREKLTALDGFFKQFLSLWQQRSLFESLLSFLPVIKKRWWLKNEFLSAQLSLSLEATTDDDVREFFAKQSTEIKLTLQSLLTELEQAKTMQMQLNELREKLASSMNQANISFDTEMISYTDLLAKIDTSLRFRAFKLATHYWEARWLQDMENGIKSPRTPDERDQTYRRYAKLTPCFVATFNMLPNFFEVAEKDGESWKNLPLVDAIDLLIVDEAGQALPHIAAASFLVAKKALLVGDIYQIEPVWSLTKGLDKANLQLNELLTDELSYSDFWLNSQLLASSGNLMKLAHRHTQYHQFTDLEQGLYLTEHRRCYDSIIQYCNKLVYKGHLQAMRGEPKASPKFPTMGFIHHQSTSLRSGASRFNSEEADFICQWLSNNAEHLSANKPVDEIVAIITPFSKQANVIKQKLQKAGFGKIKVGTVHTFQGAESDVVLFSSVYAQNDASGSKFYDRGSNMLNVAVSRAKNIFIVVGDQNIFGQSNSSSPSGILMGDLSLVDN